MVMFANFRKRKKTKKVIYTNTSHTAPVWLVPKTKNEQITPPEVSTKENKRVDTSLSCCVHKNRVMGADPAVAPPSNPRVVMKTQYIMGFFFYEFKTI